MAITVIGSTKGQSTNATTVTSAALDTTAGGGADFIFVWLCNGAVIGTGLLSDSAGNTWTATTQFNNGANTIRGFFCANPTTSATHTFGVSSGGTKPSVFVLALKGVRPTSQPDQQGSSSNNQLPSTTPTTNNQIVITGLVTLNTPGATLAVSTAGYTTPVSSDSNANAEGGGLAYVIQTTAAATAPLWNANDPNRETAIITFFAATTTSIAVPAGSLALTGFAPADTLAIPVPAGSLALTGFAPAIQPTIEVPAGSLTLTGRAPAENLTIPVPAGSLALTGFAPMVGEVIQVPAAALTITTYPPKLVFSTGGGTSGAAGWWFAGPAARMLADAGFLLLVKPVLDQRERERKGGGNADAESS